MERSEVTTPATVLEEGIQTAYCTVCNASKVPLKINQSTSKLEVTGMQEGDYVVFWKSNKPGIAKVNKNGKVTVK